MPKLVTLTVAWSFLGTREQAMITEGAGTGKSVAGAHWVGRNEVEKEIRIS